MADMKNINWPKVTLIFPTFNGGKGVRECLESVRIQDYPQNKVEVIVVDNGSKDDSVQIAKKFTKDVYIERKKDGYVNRIEAMRRATGEYVFMILEQDLVLGGKDFLKKMVRPMIEDERIVASFAAYRPRKDMPWITRIISYDPLQRDPMWEFLTYPFEKTFVEKHRDYFLCKYDKDRVPIMGRMFYRVKYLKKTPTWEMERGGDQTEVRKVVKAGYEYFAYVPKPGIYHYHAKSLGEFLYKRVRNVTTYYFPYNDILENRYADMNKKRDVVGIIIWVIYANLFFPALIRGIIRIIKYKDIAFIMEPIVTIATTDLVLWKFLTNKVGQRMLVQGIRTVLFK